MDHLDRRIADLVRRCPNNFKGFSFSSAEASSESEGQVGSLRSGDLLSGGPKKGEKHGECARTACNHTNALWWNRSTERYYCKPCARRIMSYPENAGLLTLTEPADNRRG